MHPANSAGPSRRENTTMQMPQFDTYPDLFQLLLLAGASLLDAAFPPLPGHGGLGSSAGNWAFRNPDAADREAGDLC